MSVAEASTWRPHRRFSTRFYRSELRLMSLRRRNIAGVAALAALPIVIAIVMFATKPGPGEGPPLFAGMLDNGLIAALAGLGIELALFLPIAVSVIAGDTIAGEANIGTLRYLLTTPVGRVRLLAVKFASLVTWIFAVVAIVGFTGGLTGVILFGTGDMATLSGTTIPFGEAFLRVLEAAVYMALCLVAVGAIGMFVSTLTEQPIGGAVAMMMFVIISQILGAITQLDWLHPYLISHYWTSYIDLLRDPAAWDQVGMGLLSALLWTALGLSAAWARLTTKDITS
ncbi:ABC transporter permease [Actinorhabdospora filicis]|uniref:ABC transporter permease n=1 Tax=Actinorhabdospora filicis TaxID=1785913 RepID=A0A9W6SH68_9ACTN|nr:ABC transporter permease [Actinorhabdospora filicis]GLZ75782.1 ABC transporter permease [Actinorhabdospora filicis]